MVIFWGLNNFLCRNYYIEFLRTCTILGGYFCFPPFLPPQEAKKLTRKSHRNNGCHWSLPLPPPLALWRRFLSMARVDSREMMESSKFSIYYLDFSYNYRLVSWYYCWWLTDLPLMAITFASCSMLSFWLLESVWIIRKWQVEHKMLAGRLIGRGEEWKHLCTFMQTDLMQSRHLEVMYQAWWKQHVWQVPELLHLQMASMPILADVPWTSSQPSCLENFPMCPRQPPPPIMKATSLSQVLPMAWVLSVLFLPYAITVGKQLGLITKKCQFAFTNFEQCWEIVQAKIE
jgi:hypothetical protein